MTEHKESEEKPVLRKLRKAMAAAGKQRVANKQDTSKQRINAASHQDVPEDKPSDE